MNTTNIRYTAEKTKLKSKIRVYIRLSDDYGNGHADFSITADLWELSKNGRWVETMGGCCHDEILKFFPEFSIFIDLHLSDSNGCPMYSIENGFFHMWDKEKSREERKIISKLYLRINEKEFKKLSRIKDKTYFHFMLENIGIVKKWEEQAKHAIKALEKLTGETWNNNFKWEKGNFEPLKIKEKTQIKEKIRQGFFSVANIEKIEEKRKIKEVKGKIEGIKEELKKTLKKETEEATVKIWLIQKIEKLNKKDKTGNFLMNYEDSIYYNHSNTLAFNWRGYTQGITKESFDFLKSNITKEDFKILPKGIQFQFKG